MLEEATNLSGKLKDYAKGFGAILRKDISVKIKKKNRMWGKNKDKQKTFSGGLFFEHFPLPSDAHKYTYTFVFFGGFTAIPNLHSFKKKNHMENFWQKKKKKRRNWMWNFFFFWLNDEFFLSREKSRLSVHLLLFAPAALGFFSIYEKYGFDFSLSLSHSLH